MPIAVRLGQWLVCSKSQFQHLQNGRQYRFLGIITQIKCSNMCEKALKDAQHKFSRMWGLNNFTPNNNTIQHLVRTCMPIPVLSTLHIWFSSSYKYMTGAMLTAFHLRQWRHRGINLPTASKWSERLAPESTILANTLSCPNKIIRRQCKVEWEILVNIIHDMISSWKKSGCVRGTSKCWKWTSPNGGIPCVFVSLFFVFSKLTEINIYQFLEAGGKIVI